MSMRWNKSVPELFKGTVRGLKCNVVSAWLEVMTAIDVDYAVSEQEN